MTDIEIARQSTMQPIADIAGKLGIPVEHLHHFGSHKAKISYDFIKSLEGRPLGKLILVTAITPTGHIIKNIDFIFYWKCDQLGHCKITAKNTQKK